MSKVKKRAVLTGVRNVKAGKPGRRKGATTGVARIARQATSKPKKTAGKPARKPAGKAAKTASTAASRTPLRGIRKTAPKGRGKSVAKKLSVSVAPPGRGRIGRLEPIARYAIKPLDPLRKCGPGTSVQFLYLVQESVEGKRTTHLVFFDRHGWYCEHGRTCPAVAPARKYNGHIARGA